MASFRRGTTPEQAAAILDALRAASAELAREQPDPEIVRAHVDAALAPRVTPVAAALLARDIDALCHVANEPEWRGSRREVARIIARLDPSDA